MTEKKEYTYEIQKVISNEVFIDLKINCPAEECPKRSSDPKKASYWVHSEDKGRIRISNRARMKCISCETESHMKNWVFACSAHHDGKYLKTSSSSFGQALALAFEQSLDTEVILDLITYLRKEENQWK